MKKLSRILLVIAVIMTLAAGVFQLAPDLTINVGWNSRIGSTPSQSLPLVACTFCTLPGSDATPDVGWNSRI